MLSSLFQSSTLPVLEQVVNFTEARHGVLAGNIANLDTPGYKTRDLSPELFQQRLKEAIETKNQPVSPTSTRRCGRFIADRQLRTTSDQAASGVRQSERLDEKHPASRRRRREHGKTSQRNDEEPAAAQPGDQHHERAVSAAAGSDYGTSGVDSV